MERATFREILSGRMSQENVELTYRVADAINRRDLDGFLALMAEDVRSHPQFASVEGRGHEGMRRGWENLLAGVPDFTTELIEVRDLGDDLVLAVVRNRGQGATSVVPFDNTTWLPVRWRRGKCVWWGNFLSERDALEAAGLPE